MEKLKKVSLVEWFVLISILVITACMIFSHAYSDKPNKGPKVRSCYLSKKYQFVKLVFKTSAKADYVLVEPTYRPYDTLSSDYTIELVEIPDIVTSSTDLDYFKEVFIEIPCKQVYR